jgi:SAM-dependent methyltransferase
MTASTKSHYEGHSTDSYESAYFYEPGAYTEHLKQLVQNSLQLADAASAVDNKRRLLDIGGGTGNFTRMILEDTPTVSGVVIDPFLVESSTTTATNDDDEDQIRFVRSPAEAFMQSPTEDALWWRQNYHQVLLKEVVHHFQDADRVPIFQGLYNGLLPLTGDAPSLLIVTRPQRDIDYPLWDEARQVWAKNQPSLETFVDELKQAGFTDINHHLEAYPCTILLERWQSMVKGRFWSTFSNFTDAELDEACHKIAKGEKERIDAAGNLCFEDRLLFITARK